MSISADWHTGGVLSIAFSPDGQQLASGSADCSVFLWIKIPAPSIAQEKWALAWRSANSFSLLAENAFLKGATISENNLKLLKQRGANDDQTPDYENNPHKFWSKVLSPKAESDAPTLTNKL